MKWYVGSDHAGLSLKQRLVEELQVLGDEVVDVGTHAATSVDYPDYAQQVAQRVAGESDVRGLLVCGTGIGMSITANRFRGIRAALVSEPFSAGATRAHNDANILCLGQRVVGEGVALACLEAFRNTAYEGGRHARRVAKIDENVG